jgi:hypothetical protein
VTVSLSAIVEANARWSVAARALFCLPAALRFAVFRNMILTSLVRCISPGLAHLDHAD